MSNIKTILDTIYVAGINIGGTGSGTGGILLSSSVSAAAGSKLVGDDNSYSGAFTPAAATVKGALTGIGSALVLKMNANFSNASGLLGATNGGTGQTTIAGATAALSPLTTKGDLWGFSTLNTRIPVGTDGQVLTADSTQALGVKWAGSPGTVSSIDVAVPGYMTSTGGPITSSGTISIGWASEGQNLFFASPDGTSGPPGWRAIVANEIPVLNQNTTGSAGSLSGIVALINGGTGTSASSPADAFNALSPMSATGDIVYETSPGVAAALPIGTTGQILTVDVSGVPVWSAPATSGTVTSFVFTNGGGFTGTVTSATTNPTLSLVGTLSGDITGPLTASVLSATTNSTLTTLSALSLPYSQVTGAPAALTASDSVVITAGNITLVNDSATPGASKYYGTNGSSVLGYFALPVSNVGTVTSVSVVSANGFAGTVATATSTPAITISTTITGLLKGNGTAISAATAGTDYVIPSGSITGTATNITAASNATLTTLSALSLPFSQLSGQATLAQLPSIGTLTVLGNVTGGTAVPTALSKTQLTTLINPFTAALSGAAPASFGGTTNFLRADGTWASPPGAGSGSVTNFSFTNGGGFTGTVTSPSTTPTLSLVGALTGDITGSLTATVLSATSNATLTTLSGLTTASSLASVGTITTGTWNGTAIAIAHGGTGQITAAAAYNALSPMTTTGDLEYESGTNTASRLPIGTTGQVLTVVGGLPAWAAAGSGGVTTVATIDTSPNANGLFISGTNISTQSASATQPGMVTTGTQTFAGNKTFSGQITVKSPLSITQQTPNTIAYASFNNGTNTSYIGMDGSGLLNLSPGNMILSSASGTSLNLGSTTAFQITLSAGKIQFTDGTQGTAGYVWTSIDTVGTGSWLAPSGFANPMTTAGDLLFENATPAPARLPIGTTGQVLTVVAGLPAWATATTGANTALSNLTATSINQSLVFAGGPSVNGTSGSLLLNTPNAAGASGSISLTSGNSSGASPGNVNITAGSSTGSGGFNAGLVTITSGSATNAAGNASPGQIQIYGGNNSNASGQMYTFSPNDGFSVTSISVALQGGTQASTSDSQPAGGIALRGGQSLSATAAGGALDLRGGYNTVNSSSASGGEVLIQGGNNTGTSSTGAGGSITLTSGNNTAGSGASGNVLIQSAIPGSTGNSGNISLVIGSSGATQGSIKFLKTGVASVVGQVWTASATDGTGYWATGGSGANTALSNLASTAVNANIVPASNNSVTLGTAGSIQFLSASALRYWSFFSPDAMVMGLLTGVGNGLSVTGMGIGQVGIASFPTLAQDPLWIISSSDATANAIATADVQTITGNKTAGTGNSGQIVLATGTSTGGATGSISLTVGAAGTGTAGSIGINAGTSTSGANGSVNINSGGGASAVVGGGINLFTNGNQIAGSINIETNNQNSTTHGGDINIFAGSQSAAGGDGGNLFLAAGTGLTPSPGASGGSTTIQSGAANASSGNGKPGQLLIEGGGNNSSTPTAWSSLTVDGNTSAACSVLVTAGGQNSSTANGPGGNVIVQGGFAQSTTAGSNGGQVFIAGGYVGNQASIPSTGGAVNILGGGQQSSAGTGGGGAVNIKGGIVAGGGSSTGNGGAVNISTPTMQSGNLGSSGAISLTTGNTAATGTGNSGNILLTTGSSTGGTQGVFKFLKTGVAPTVGQVWTASATDGTGYWANVGTVTAPTIQRFTSSGTYTRPTGPTPVWIRVRLVGGGGGGAGSGTTGTAGNGGVATAATASSFGTSLLTANAGTSATANSTSGGGAGGAFTVSGPAVDVASVNGGGGGGQGGQAGGVNLGMPGGMGGSSFFGGAGQAGGAASGSQSAGGAGQARTGGGGGGGGSSSNGAAVIVSGAGGGSGGYVEAIITSPTTTYTVVVGVGGSGGTAGTNGVAGGVGGTGVVIVEEFYN